MAKEGRLLAYRHQGFWQPADTVKERHALEAAYQRGNRPWMIWEQDHDDAVELLPEPHRLRPGAVAVR